jgi:hypothetical protein
VAVEPKAAKYPQYAFRIEESAYGSPMNLGPREISAAAGSPVFGRLSL